MKLTGLQEQVCNMNRVSDRHTMSDIGKEVDQLENAYAKTVYKVKQ